MADLFEGDSQEQNTPVEAPASTPVEQPTPNPADIAGNTMAQMGQDATPGDAPATPAPVPGDAGQQPAPTPAAEPVQYTGILDFAKQNGIDLGQQFQDDGQAFQALVDGYRYKQATQTYEPYLQRYLQHAPQFEQWLTTQQAQTPKPEEAKPVWSPPAKADEVQRLLSSYYERDANGTLQAKANAPLEARQKVEGYSQYVQDWQYKLQHDPLTALQPLVQEMVKPLLQQERQRAVQEHQQQEMLRRNQDWLFEKDATTKGVRTDPRTNQPLLSPQGQVFARYLQEARGYGINDLAAQEMYALKQTNADLLEAQRQQGVQQGVQQGQPQLTQQQRNQQFLAFANRRPNTGAPVVNGTMPPSQQGLSLAESMRASLKAAGIDPGVEEAQQLGVA